MKIKYSARFDLVHWLKWSFSYTIYFRLGRVCYVPCFFSSAINAIVVICGSVEFFFPYVFSLFVGAFFPTKKKNVLLFVHTLFCSTQTSLEHIHMSKTLQFSQFCCATVGSGFRSFYSIPWSACISLLSSVCYV